MAVTYDQICDYHVQLSDHRNPTLQRMEEEARQEQFPIIGPASGQFCYLMARASGARRIFELGSGYGYSGYWFSRATGPDAEIHLTDGDARNETLALDFLGRAGLDKPIRYHVGDALEALSRTEGDFDIIYCDIDKPGYPDAWRMAKEKVRVGGYYMCDNMLWSGMVTGESDSPERQEGATEAIKETNEMIASDPSWHSIINPTRDGVVTALRIA